MKDPTILVVANWDWVLYNFRLPLVRGLEKAGARVILISPEGKYSNQFEGLGFEFIPWKLTRESLGVFKEITAILDLIRLYRKIKPDAVHHVTIKPNLYGTVAAILACVHAVVNNFTGLGYLFTDTKKASGIRKLIFPILRMVLSEKRVHSVFQTQEDLDRMALLGLVDPSRTSVITGSGVDLDKFNTGKSGRDLSEPPTVVMAARLLWDKGIQELLDATKEILHEGISARFIVAGTPDSGNPASVSEAQLAAWREDGLIEFPGQVADMPQLLRSADIAVLPSYHEGVSLFLLEAAASGLPIITTDLPGSRLIVKQDENGLLVPVKDSKKLKEALVKLIIDKELRQKMGKVSLKIAKTQFSKEIIVDQYIEVYRQLGVF